MMTRSNRFVVRSLVSSSVIALTCAAASIASSEAQAAQVGSAKTASPQTAVTQESPTAKEAPAQQIQKAQTTSGISAAPPAPGTPETPADSKEIVVTGTSIRGVSAVGTQMLALGREQLKQSGKSNPVDVLRELPQVQGFGFDETPRTTNSGNIQRGRALNLRGIGSNATLLLIDGNRVAPTGNVFSFTEADQLPTSMIERVEVIVDGASAIYGSDAVAGVVNYIPRKNLNGVELTLRGTTTDGYKGWGGSALVGHKWSTGGFVLAFDYDDRGEMRMGDSAFLRRDLRPFGGPDRRLVNNIADIGAQASIIVPRPSATGPNPTIPNAGFFNYFTVPAGTNGTGLTAANLIVNNPVLVDQADFTSFLPATKREEVALTAHQDINDWLSASILAFYRNRDSVAHVIPLPGINLGNPFTNVVVRASSPFYIPGVPGIAPGAPETVLFSLGKDIGIGTTHIYESQYQASGTLRARLFGDWVGQLIGNYSRNDNCAICINAMKQNIDQARLQAAIDSGRYNPFSSLPVPPDVLASFAGPGYDKNRATLKEATLRFDGSLFHLPGGNAKGAIGGSFLHMTQFRTAVGQGAGRDLPSASADRNVWAAYAELFFPLVGGDFTLPGVKRFDLSVAGRIEHYSDFGSTSNPKFGFNWTVIDGLKLRGSWARAFRAPNLIENNPAFFRNLSIQTVSNGARDPAIPVDNPATGTTNILRQNGSEANLKPETARNWSIGAEVTPPMIPGFDARVSYYHLKYANQIITLNGPSATFIATAGNRALYSPYIIPAPQPATCVNGVPSTYAPIYQQLLTQPLSAAPNQSNFCSAKAIFLAQNTNVGSTIQSGLDFQLGYSFEALDSSWHFSSNFTKILHNRQTLVKGGPTIDQRDLINQPISSRGRADLSWTKGDFTLSPAVNYVGKYVNNAPLTVNGVLQPIKTIPAWVTFDLAANVRFDHLGFWGRGLELNVVASNLFDRDPPVVLSGTQFAFDPQAANVFGRIISVQLAKRF